MGEGGLSILLNLSECHTLMHKCSYQGAQGGGESGLYIL